MPLRSPSLFSSSVEKSKPSSLSLLLGASLWAASPTAEAKIEPYGLDVNESLTQDARDKIRVCFELLEDGGHLAYYRFANAACEDPVDEIFVHGVLGDGALAAPYAHAMSEEQARRFISVDLPGHGNSSPIPASIKQRDINPVLMASYLIPFARKRLKYSSHPQISGHSAGGTIATLMLEGLPKNVLASLINPALTTQKDDILYPGSHFPIACDLGEITTRIARRGFTAEVPEGKKRGPGILGLSGKDNRLLAERSNFALKMEVDPKYADIPNHVSDDPYQNTPVARQARSLQAKCEDPRGLVNGMRWGNRVDLWRGDYLEALNEHQNQIFIVTTQRDAVIRAIGVDGFLEDNKLNIRHVSLKEGGHEVHGTHPQLVLETINHLKAEREKQKPRPKWHQKNEPVKPLDTPDPQPLAFIIKRDQLSQIHPDFLPEFPALPQIPDGRFSQKDPEQSFAPFSP